MWVSSKKMMKFFEWSSDDLDDVCKLLVINILLNKWDK